MQAGPIFTIDDEPLPDSFESSLKQNPQLALDIPNLLSVNQLLESVSYYGLLLAEKSYYVKYKEKYTGGAMNPACQPHIHSVIRELCDWNLFFTMLLFTNDILVPCS